MIDAWSAILLSLAVGAGIGWSLCQQRAARDLARLLELVPSPGLLRWAAEALHYAAEGRGIDGNIVPLLFRRLEELAARIEAAEEGAGAESVAVTGEGE